MAFEHNVKLAGTVTVGPKGQVVIPAEVREQMQFGPGDKLVALYIKDKKSVLLITEEQAQAFVTHMGEQFTQFKKDLEEGKEA